MFTVLANWISFENDGQSRLKAKNKKINSIVLHLFNVANIGQKTHHEMKIPERDVTYIDLSVYLLTLTSPVRQK